MSKRARKTDVVGWKDPKPKMYSLPEFDLYCMEGKGTEIQKNSDFLLQFQYDQAQDYLQTFVSLSDDSKEIKAVITTIKYWDSFQFIQKSHNLLQFETEWPWTECHFRAFALNYVRDFEPFFNAFIISRFNMKFRQTGKATRLLPPQFQDWPLSFSVIETQVYASRGNVRTSLVSANLV